MSGNDVRQPTAEVSDNEPTQSGRGVVGVQVAAYLVLVLSAVLVALWPSTVVTLCWIAVVGALMIGGLLYRWPFSDTVTTSLVERIVSGIVGLCSFLVALYTVPTIMQTINAESLSPMSWWALAFGGLITLLVIVGFMTQMLRRVRSHLIQSLSHAVFGGIACVSAAGWSFLPVMIGIGKSSAGVKHVVGCILVALVVIVILLSLGAAAASWWREDSGRDSQLRTGIALLPVMIGGIAIYMATLAVFFLVF